MTDNLNTSSSQTNYIQYGDIIQIESPDNDLLNNKFFFVNYISPDRLELLEETISEKIILNIKDGNILENDITSISIIHREESPSFAIQNNLTIGVWVNIEFGGSIPFIITGEIVNIEEDMIEIALIDSSEKVYIDFGYKGLPIDLLINKITIRDSPQEDAKNKELHDDIESEEKMEENLKNGMAITSSLEFEELQELIEIVDIPDSEYRYLLEEQTNDLLEQMISKLGTYERDHKKIERINKIINRFVELRELYSIFKDYTTEGINYGEELPLKNMLMENKEKINWIIPVTNYIKNIYADPDVVSDQSDVRLINILEELKKEEDFYNNYSTNSLKVENKVKELINKINFFYKHYTLIPNSENTQIKLTNVNNLVLLNNFGNNESSVFLDESIETNESVLDNLNENDMIKLLGYVMLPKNIQYYSKQFFISSSILEKCELSQIPFYISLFLKKKSYIKNYNSQDNPNKTCNFLENINFYNNNEENIDSFFDKILLNNNSLIDCISSHETSVLKYLNNYVSYGVNIYNIKSETINKIVKNLKENVKKYKKKLIENQKKIGFSKKDPPANNIFEKLFLEEEYKLLLEKYNIKKSQEGVQSNEFYSMSELLNHTILDDNLFLFSYVMSKFKHLKSLISAEDADSYVNLSTHELEDCTMPIILKHYNSKESLESDNNKKIVADKKLDKTDYSLRSKYVAEEAKLNNGEFRNFLIKELIRTKNLSIEEATREMESIINGELEIIEGDYALLKINNDDEMSENYYVRRENSWILDENINMLCNVKENCIQTDDNCLSLHDSENIKNRKVVDEILSESSNIKQEFNISDREYLIEMEKNLLNTLLFKQMHELKYNNQKIQIGNLLDEATLLESPFEAIKNKILKDSDLVNKFKNIQLFVSKYTRNYVDDENENWLYCIESGYKLLPLFLYKLANAFLTYDNYEETLKKICAIQGTISDDGDSIVDKHSGYIIKKIELESVDEYTEEGFLNVYHDVMEEEYKYINEDEEFDKENIERLPEINKKIKNIILAITNFMNVNLTNEMEFIMFHVLKNHKNIIGTKKDYMAKNKKEPYEIVSNKALIGLSLSMIVIVVQTSIPSIKLVKSFSGCTKSIEGYPLEEDESNKQFIQYVSCIANKIKGSFEPWNSLSKMTEIKIEIMVSTFIKKYMLNNLEISERLSNKRNYLLDEKMDELDINIYRAWDNFLPLLGKLEMNEYQSMPEVFYNQLDNSIKKGSLKQVKLINMLYGKILQSSFHFQKSIHSLVSSKQLLLLNSLDEPFLENACCNDGAMNTLEYFLSLSNSSQIKRYLDANNFLVNKYESIKSLEKEPFLYNADDTRNIKPILTEEYSEEVIYRAFIQLANLENELEIPELFASFVTNKPGDEYNKYEEDINLKIKTLKDSGFNFSETDLLEVIRLICKQNIINNNDALLASKKDRLQEYLLLLLSENNKDVISDLLLEQLQEIIVNKNEKNEIIFKDTIKEVIDVKITKILTAIKGSGLLKKKDLEELNEFLNNYYNIQLNDAECVSLVRNQLQLITMQIPNWIINNTNPCDFVIPKYWNLSSIHINDILNKDPLNLGFVPKYYQYFVPFLDNEHVREHMRIILNKLNNVNKIIKLFPNINAKDENNFNIEKLSSLYLFHYEFLVAIEIYLEDATNNIDIIKFVINILKLCLNDKNKLNYSYDDIMKRVNRSKDKEKERKTTHLKDLTVDERAVDNVLKQHKLGKWNIGLQKGLVNYDKDFYDDEKIQKALESIYDIEKATEYTANLEENDLRGLANDDDYGELDGDEFY